MKKTYSAPQARVCKFKAEDVLTLSGFLNIKSTLDNIGDWRSDWTDQ